MRKQSNSFVKASMTLISGSLMAQMLSVAVSPVITRLYSEAEIGEYTLILTAVSLFGGVLCGRYDASIVTEEKEESTFALIKLSAGITLLVSFLVGMGYSVYYTAAESLTLGPVAVFGWLFFLLLAQGAGLILTAWNNRQKQYKLITSVYVVREAGRDVTLIGAGLLQGGTLGLLTAQAVSLLLGLGRQAAGLRQAFPKIWHCPAAQVKQAAVKHRKQPLLSVPACFANGFSYTAINLFVTSLFGLEALAYYSMSYRLLGIPLNLLSGNVSKVFFEKAAREYDRTGSYRGSFLMTTVLTGAVAVPMVALLMWLAPALFGFFFGENWTVSGYYVRYLAPMFGVRLVVSTLSPSMIISAKQDKELALQAGFLLASVCLYVISRAGNLPMEGYLLRITVLYSIIYLIYYLYMYRISRGERNG